MPGAPADVADIPGDGVQLTRPAAWRNSSLLMGYRVFCAEVVMLMLQERGAGAERHSDQTSC